MNDVRLQQDAENQCNKINENEFEYYLNESEELLSLCTNIIENSDDNIIKIFFRNNYIEELSGELNLEEYFKNIQNLINMVDKKINQIKQDKITEKKRLEEKKKKRN